MNPAHVIDLTTPMAPRPNPNLNTNPTPEQLGELRDAIIDIFRMKPTHEEEIAFDPTEVFKSKDFLDFVADVFHVHEVVEDEGYNVPGGVIHH